MSRWTHVAGTIRVDGLAGFKEPEFEKLFKVARWDVASSFKTCNMPVGSEGSLQYSVWTNPDPTHLARYTITIWGDLRDYGELEDIYKIEKWFRKVLKKLDLIREAVMIVVDSQNKNSCIMTVVGNNEVRTLQFKEKIK